MLAALKIDKYPYFDLSEVTNEPDLLIKPYRALRPLKAGDDVPNFSFQRETGRWRQFINGSFVNAHVDLNKLLNKPLVIGFYSSQWQNYGIDYLKKLNDIHAEIKASGGNLLIIIDEMESKLEKLAWDQMFSLSFYIDTDKEIAENFNLYSDSDPAWNKFSGIDTNVPLLAAYVLSASGQIAYHHIEQDFEVDFPSKEIISSVYNASIDKNNIRNLKEQVVR